MRSITQRRPRWPLLLSTRTRVLAAFLILLAFSTVISTLALRQLLLARVNERVDASLLQEVQELEILASRGRDPQTAEPFGTDIASIFDTFLGRNVPDAGEAALAFVGAELYRRSPVSGAPFDQRQLSALPPSSGPGAARSRPTAATCATRPCRSSPRASAWARS